MLSFMLSADVGLSGNKAVVPNGGNCARTDAAASSESNVAKNKCFSSFISVFLNYYFVNYGSTRKYQLIQQSFIKFLTPVVHHTIQMRLRAGKFTRFGYRECSNDQRQNADDALV